MTSKTVQGGASHPAGSTWQLPASLRRVLLLVPPLLLAGLEIAHPQPQMNVQAIMDASTWFATFHVIQLALIGLVAMSVLLLADNYGRATSWPTRIGIGMFMVFFSAYDTLAGIGTGLAMRSARGPIGGTARRRLSGRQGLAWSGCTVRTQHPRHSRVGSRSRCARASRSPTGSSATRVAGVGACCRLLIGWASVSRGNPCLRILLCGSPLLRIEVQSSRHCARDLSLSAPQHLVLRRPVIAAD